jgi:hypothetical protein
MKHLFALVLFAAACGTWPFEGQGIDVARPQSKVSRTSRMQVAAPAVTLPKEPRDLNHSPPRSIRNWYFNNTKPGSCVQCAIGINSVRHHNEAGETLFFDTDKFGPAILGPSGPQRVAQYCQERGIPIFNVTGDASLAWLKYAAATGRGAALCFDTDHFQTLMGYDAKAKRWLVCDNRTPWKIDDYSEDDFAAIHRASGLWVVVLDLPAPPPPPAIAAFHS